ncbi:MAG: ATP-grasp domain-containing protein [Oligoflexales bacterium]|nr:ATP-grasp domain-containing protein [Oligoflexales bacterium]
MLKKVFIANRGEIARRIAKSAKELGLETVCCTDKDIPPHYLRRWIDEFVKVEQEASSLYLNQKLLVDLACQYGCDSVHPGFGFLSENPDFADKVQEAGLVWIGPKPKVIATMASKAKAREIAEAIRIPCTKGLKGIKEPDAKTIEVAKSFAKETGFPLLVKAAMGGGGKGMRLVHKLPELEDALARASSEALNSFGDSSLILELYIETSRHVEVQVLGDELGNIVILGDRDCSLQRRHQKIIEEAPAPKLHPETRKKLHNSAKALAQEVGYSSAGTVEFILDAQVSDAEEQAFYFLEMNTRLQVEHPVTEEVFGLDLVAWQFRIAGGESIEGLNDAMKANPSLHSVEARFYGEDPRKNFFPAPGEVHCFAPFYGQGIRWEVGLDGVDLITSNFDPMIAKVVATAPTRKQAIKKLSYCLQETVFFGPENNREFLVSLLNDEAFAEESFSTAFIAQKLESLNRHCDVKREKREELAQKIFDALIEKSKLGKRASEAKLLGSVDVNGITSQAFSKKHADLQADDSLNLLVVEQSFLPKSNQVDGDLIYGLGLVESKENGKLEFRFGACLTQKGEFWYLHLEGICYTRNLEKSIWEGLKGSEESSAGIEAPVPGKVVKISCRSGEEISKDQALFILESMKMEFEVRALKSGKIEEVLVANGDQVTAGQQLANFQK